MSIKDSDDKLLFLKKFGQSLQEARLEEGIFDWWDELKFGWEYNKRVQKAMEKDSKEHAQLILTDPKEWARRTRMQAKAARLGWEKELAAYRESKKLKKKMEIDDYQKMLGVAQGSVEDMAQKMVAREKFLKQFPGADDSDAPDHGKDPNEVLSSASKNAKAKKDFNEKDRMNAPKQDTSYDWEPAPKAKGKVRRTTSGGHWQYKKKGQK